MLPLIKTYKKDLWIYIFPMLWELWKNNILKTLSLSIDGLVTLWYKYMKKYINISFTENLTTAGQIMLTAKVSR